MKNTHVSIFAAAALSLLLGACVSVDSRVSETPSRYWKAPKDALPEEFFSPSQIRTDSIERASAEGGAKGAATASDKLVSGAVLSLPDLVDIALENNTVTRQYWFQAKVYAAQKGQTDAQYMPSVSVGAQVYYKKTRQISTSPLGIGTYWDVGYGPSLQMNWLLYNFGKREAQSDAARESLRAANFDFNQSIQDVVLNVYVGYFNLYSAISSVKTAEANLEDARNAYKDAAARLENNVGRKQDALRALANAKNAEYALEQARASVEDARASLASALGVEVSQNLNISEDFVLPSSPEAEKKIEELMASALRERQSVLAAYSRLGAAAHNTRASERNFLPEIGGVGAMEWVDFANDRYYHAPSNNYMIGATLSWNIFDGFANQYELISAKAKERAAAQQLKAEEISIISNVWTNFYAYKSALKQLESTSAAVQAAEEAYSATDEAYKSGVGTLTDLLNSQSLLAQARQQKVSAEAFLAISVARLAHATGALTGGIAPDGDSASEG